MRTLFLILLPALFLLNLFVGSADIPFGEIIKVLTFTSDNEVFQIIILENRLPQALTAVVSGAALAVSGLIMQTVFANPLAGPSVLGISSASSLGVAVVTFIFSSIFASFNTTFSVIFGALIGSGVALLLLIFLSGVVRNNITLLIMGMMVSYICSSLITVLNFFGTEESVKNFTVWTSGSFAGVALGDIPLYFGIVVVAVSASFFTIKPLNLLLLGENYAQNLGLNIRRTKTVLLVVSGVLTSVVTAYCGPVSFIGLAVPHVSRLIMKTSNHHNILPMSVLIGACVALLCNMLTLLPGSGGILPLNAVTPFFGAPVIVWVLLSGRRIKL